MSKMMMIEETDVMTNNLSSTPQDSTSKIDSTSFCEKATNSQALLKQES